MEFYKWCQQSSSSNLTELKGIVVYYIRIFLQYLVPLYQTSAQGRGLGSASVRSLWLSPFHPLHGQSVVYLVYPLSLAHSAAMLSRSLSLHEIYPWCPCCKCFRTGCFCRFFGSSSAIVWICIPYSVFMFCVLVVVVVAAVVVALVVVVFWVYAARSFYILHESCHTHADTHTQRDAERAVGFHGGDCWAQKDFAN